jgi:UDP-GlcNAc:undecaprenyl-phosphate GlcNAc-1-phosphate transferase
VWFRFPWGVGLSSALSAILIFCATGMASWLLVRPAAWLGVRLGIVDLPDERRTKRRPIPTTGGLVVYSTIVGSLFVALRVHGTVEPEVAGKLLVLMAGGAAVVVLGMLDDKLNLRPQIKLGAQVAIAVVMAWGGVGIDRMRFLFGPAFDVGWLGYPLTVFWFVGFMNAINLIDGLDGLASGIAAIAAGGLVAVGILNQNPILYLMAAGMLGSTLGFLFHNYRKGDIYLGDAGSMVLGFFLAGGAIIGAYGDGASNALLVGSACMVVPAFDVVTSILRRRRAQRGIMVADRSHIHHRLIRFGLHPKIAVLLLWGVTVFFGGQMLGFIAPHGVLYIVASYVVAGLVAKEVIKQHRKNVKTINSNLGQDLVDLIGVGSGEDGDPDAEEMSLHELIVAQIRREVHHRRLTRGKVRGPLPDARQSASSATADTSTTQEPALAARAEEDDDLVLEADERRRA